MSFLARIFTRSRSLERLNAALREVGLDPYGFPEAVRLTMVRLAKANLGLPQRGEPRGAEEERLRRELDWIGWLFAYCYLGAADSGLGEAEVAALERRLQAAEQAPQGPEAQVVSLVLLTGNAHDSLAERFEASFEGE